MFVINRVIVSGGLGGDPERIASDKGCKFSIAVDERFKNGDDWESRTNWFDVVAWGSLADQIVKQLSKGSRVCIEGRLRQEKWKNKDGENRYSVGIVADAFFFPKTDSSSNGSGSYESDVPADTEGMQQASGSSEFTEEIPF